jgi:hypothetical protein
VSDFHQAWASATPAPHPRAPADTPPGAEDRIRELSGALEENEKALVDAADAELDAQGALDDAEARWRLDTACPVPGVFDGKRVSVAYVDAWVTDKTTLERLGLRVARQRRQAAEKQRDRISRQLIAAQSIAKSVAETSRAYGRLP